MILLPHIRRMLIDAALSLGASLTLLTAVPVFAQEVPGGEAVEAYFILILALTFVPFHIYWAITTQIIARKTNTRKGWLAWIPIANVVLWASIARKPYWWGLLCLVPLVGLVFSVLLWVEIAKARNKPNWWGILFIVPIVNQVVPGYLAWSR
jgi:hypothetical protein